MLGIGDCGFHAALLGIVPVFFRGVRAVSAASPFAETRELPSTPQLQVNPVADLEKFREQQQRSLEEYAWENRQAGAVRVPIERAMELLLQKVCRLRRPRAVQPRKKKADATRKGSPQQ